MGRKIVKVASTRKTVEWIFQIDFNAIDLSVSSQPRIAFLSGLGRSYYPEDPGFSKFSLVYQSNLEETPPCTYLPPVERIQKPISNKGFGIDGLSAPRFSTILQHEYNPSPDKYQAELCPPMLNPRRKAIPPAEDVHRLRPTDPYVVRKQLALNRQLDHQCQVSFGRLKALPRFGRPPTSGIAGVGSYKTTKQGSSKLYANASFGRSPVLHDHSTDIKCVHEKPELCIECGRSLTITDFYRTRFTVRVPLPESRLVADLPNDFPTGLKFVNLCNVCYYRAMKGRSKNWPKNKLKFLFKKTRTCASIHDHQRMPEIIHKAGCKTVRRLQMKESILSKYFPDRVEESINVKA